MLLIDFNAQNDRKTVLALGYFDCLHIGHQKLLETVKEMATEMRALSAVFTFSNNPGSLLKSKNKMVNTFDERLELFENFGMDAVFHAEFTQKFMNMPAKEFLSALRSKNVAGIVCGFDYSFGKNSEGTVQVLKDYCAQHGVSFAVVDMVGFGGEKASATLIKSLLCQGKIEDANKCLGHEYFITSNVVHGHGVGAKQLFPTANIAVATGKLLPKDGVYAGAAKVQGNVYPCVINVGARPTFGDEESAVETHVIGYDGNIYGEKLTLYFKKYLRAIKKFDSANDLKEQIANDIKAAQNV